MRDKLFRHRASIEKLIRFGVVGATATLTYYLVSVALLSYWNVYFASIGGFLVGVFVSYFGHKHITFRFSSTSANDSRFGRHAFTALGALVFSQLVLYGTTVYLKMPDLLALALVVVTVPVFTFILYQFWVFRHE